MRTLDARTVAQLRIGATAWALAAGTIWLLLRGADQPWWALLSGAVGFMAVRQPYSVALLAIPVAVMGPEWPLARLVALTMIATVAFVLLLRPRELRFGRGHVFAAVLVAALLAAVMWPQLIPVPLRHFDLITLVFGVVVFAVFATSRVPAHAVAATVALAGAGAAALVLTAANLGWSELARWEGGRLTGLAHNPNGLALLVTLPLIAALGLAWYRRQPWWALAAVPCAALIVLTASRGATVAAFCGLAFLVVAGRRWWWQAAGLPAAALVALGFCQLVYVSDPPPKPAVVTAIQSAAPSAAPASAAPVSAPSAAPTLPHPVTAQWQLGGPRAAKDLEFNNGVRYRAALLAVKTAVRYPLRGIGYAAFPHYAQALPGFGIYIGTHNEYLRMAAEAGIAAPLALVLLLWLGLWHGLQRRDDGNAGPVLRALVAGYAVAMLFFTPLSNVSMSIAFWAALGTLVAAAPGRTARHESDAAAAYK